MRQASALPHSLVLPLLSPGLRTPSVKAIEDSEKVFRRPQQSAREGSVAADRALLAAASSAARLLLWSLEQQREEQRGSECSKDEPQDQPPRVSRWGALPLAEFAAAKLSLHKRVVVEIFFGLFF